ncbi:glutamate ABC transporter substrate-binding protein [Nocardia sp. MW-W600-9]
MSINRALRAGICAVALVVAATATAACGSTERRSALENARAGTLTIGIKFDQPGLGLRIADGVYRGFDVEVAMYVAGKLGVRPERITFKEAPSAQRETMIENGQVDFIVATYSINDKRKNRVDFAGPYYVAGQDLLVRAAETVVTGPQALSADTRVCSVTGSTPALYIAKNFPHTRIHTYDSYSQCVEALRTGAVDAVTTDNVILAGYAAQSPGLFTLVNKTFTAEKYGIGLKKSDTELRRTINDAIEAMILDGSWQAAQEKSFAGTGFVVSQPPLVDHY